MKIQSPVTAAFFGDRKRQVLLAAGLTAIVLLVVGGMWALRSPAANGGPDGSGLAAAAAQSPAAASTPSALSSDAPAPAADPASPADPAVPPVPSAQAPQQNDAPPAATSGPAEQELAATPQTVAAPVAISDAADLQEGVTATISGLEAVAGEAAGPGEISGPSIRFVVTVHNKSTEAVSLEGAFVNVEAGADRIPALQLSGPGATRFQPTVEAGASASAVYVFLLPLDQRDQVQIYLNYQVSEPIAAFNGSVPSSESTS